MLATAAALSSLGGDCDDDIVSDPLFRDWCGDTLCDWTLDVGHIHPVPTWLPTDLGVSFDDTPTQISQVTSESQATCLLFTTVANFDATAQMTLLIDFNNDGAIDKTEALPTAAWEMVQVEFPAPAVYDGITFHIRKEGTGTAVLAEMNVQSTTGCGAAAPPLQGLLLGDVCTTDSQCASGVCSGVNDLGVNTCAQCSATVTCSNGPRCEDGLYEFAQCMPAERLGTPGDLCVNGLDCVSGACSGFSVVNVIDAGSLDYAGCDVRETDAGIGAEPLCLPIQAVVHGGTCD